MSIGIFSISTPAKANVAAKLVIDVIQTYSTFLAAANHGQDGQCHLPQDRTISTIPIWRLANGDCVTNKRVVVVGASISANYLGVLGPADAIANMHGNSGKVKNLADFGAGSPQMIAALGNEDLDGVGAIFGIDLFYWDSFRGRCEDAIKNIDAMIALAEQKGIKLFLGNVPNESQTKVASWIKPIWKPQNLNCLAKINRTLAAKCIPSPRRQCFLVDFIDMVNSFNTRGYFEIDGNQLPTNMIRSDGLHFSSTGSLLTAELALRKMNESGLGCGNTTSPASSEPQQ